MVEEDRRAEAAGDGRLSADAAPSAALASPATRWGAIWTVFAGGLVCGAYMTKVAPALPLQRAELGLDLVESGFIATTFNLMGGVLGVFAGAAASRIGLRRTALAEIGRAHV